MLDILLIYPQHSLDQGATMETPLMAPLGLTFLAAILEHNGFTVSVLDNSLEHLSQEELLRRVQGVSLIGISCMVTNYRATIDLAQAIKKISTTPVVVGGPHATICPELFQKPCIDFIALGEGEQTLLELCQALLCGGDPSKVLGLLRRVDSDWAPTGNRERIKDLDGIISHPQRSHLLVLNYLNRTPEVDAYPTLSISTSRGCPYACTFCSVQGIWGRTYRTFSVDWILDEIQGLVKEYGAKGLYFYEDNFTLLQERVEGICGGLLKRGLDLRWACEGRVGSLSPPLLQKMKSAGCQTVKFGIESGSPRILSLIDKDISLDKIRETRLLCRQVGVQFACFFLIGIPTETDEDRLMTFRLIEDIRPDVSVFNVYTPFPGSPLYRKMLIERLYHNKDDNGILHRSAEEEARLRVWLRKLQGAFN